MTETEVRESIEKAVRFLMEDFISKDGKMSMDDLRIYKEFSDFGHMMTDLAIKGTGVDYIKDRLKELD